MERLVRAAICLALSRYLGLWPWGFAKDHKEMQVVLCNAKHSIASH